MSLPVVLREAAQQEFDEAFDYYESQRPGTGIVFAGKVQDAFDRIASNPLLHAEVFADIRKTVVQRFPYRVFYRPHEDRVEVLSIFHTSRDPRIWKKR